MEPPFLPYLAADTAMKNYRDAETATHSGGASRDNESSTRKILDLCSKATQETTDSPSIFNGFSGKYGSGRCFKHAILMHTLFSRAWD